MTPRRRPRPPGREVCATAALVVAVALGACARSHTPGASTDSGPDAGADADRHFCFDLGRAECEAMPRTVCSFRHRGEEWGCPAMMPEEICTPQLRFERVGGRLVTACQIEQPCPTGSKFCVVGSCSGGEAPWAGSPWEAQIGPCAFEIVAPDGRDTVTYHHDWATFCIPPDATAEEFACTLIQVLPDDDS